MTGKDDNVHELFTKLKESIGTTENSDVLEHILRETKGIFESVTRERYAAIAFPVILKAGLEDAVLNKRGAPNPAAVAGRACDYADALMNEIRKRGRS